MRLRKGLREQMVLSRAGKEKQGREGKGALPAEGLQEQEHGD